MAQSPSGAVDAPEPADLARAPGWTAQHTEPLGRVTPNFRISSLKIIQEAVKFTLGHLDIPYR